MQLNSSTPHFTPSALLYGTMYGSTELRKELAALVNTHFKAKRNVDEHNIFVTNGAGSAVNDLILTTCDAGDGVLIPCGFFHVFFNVLYCQQAHMAMRSSLLWRF